MASADMLVTLRPGGDDDSRITTTPEPTDVTTTTVAPPPAATASLDFTDVDFTDVDFTDVDDTGRAPGAQSYFDNMDGVNRSYCVAAGHLERTDSSCAT